MGSGGLQIRTWQAGDSGQAICASLPRIPGGIAEIGLHGACECTKPGRADYLYRNDPPSLSKRCSFSGTAVRR
ncbi:MAG: hypothetical protein AAFN16_22735, partial [Pseudomonadota bacterium]